ncbi:MAG TPA: PfkB family carbohydrate kinase [Caulobacteraceae bacterium]|jgi:pyridoxine kinase
MPLALILSSHVASSRVGGFVQALALAQLKIDPMVVPTVLFGRHPGWGPPGGDPVGVETFQGILDGIEANGLFGAVDLVITGYFSNGAQVRAAARAIDKIRGAQRTAAYAKAARIVVDPVMGDEGKGLYVNAEVAEAVANELVPRADLVTPNAWEMERLTGSPVRDPRAARAAGRLLGKPVLVSSVPHRSEMAVVYADGAEAWLAAHPPKATAPNGTGDLLTALFAAALIEDQPISYALARAVGAVFETVASAEAWDASELPVVAMGSRLRQASATVRIERLI